MRNFLKAIGAGFAAGIAKYHQVRDQQRKRAQMPDPLIGA